MKCIIADAGPIIALCKIDKLNLLITLFKTCYITAEVYNEVISGNDIAIDCIKLAVENKQLIIETTYIKEQASVRLLDIRGSHFNNDRFK
jgi:predicted nucleic acid-binding protein